MSNNKSLLVNDLDINLIYLAAEGDPAHPVLSFEKTACVQFAIRRFMGKTMFTPLRFNLFFRDI